MPEITGYIVMIKPTDRHEFHTCTLAQLKKGEKAMITGFALSDGDESCQLCRRLFEMGFVQGESVSIVAEAFPMRDPLAVRVGDATFALRHREASLVHVSRHFPA